MEKIAFTSTSKTESGYADQVRECERIYGTMPEKMFNLGSQIFQKFESDQFPLHPKEWAAWMHNADYVVRDGKIIFGLVEKAHEWRLRRVFELFHTKLAKHFNTQIYYALNGEIFDYAGYGIK